MSAKKSSNALSVKPVISFCQKLRKTGFCRPETKPFHLPLGTAPARRERGQLTALFTTTARARAYEWGTIADATPVGREGTEVPTRGQPGQQPEARLCGIDGSVVVKPSQMPLWKPDYFVCCRQGVD